MKNIYIEYKQDLLEAVARKEFANAIAGYECNVVEDMDKADLVFKQVSTERALSYRNKPTDKDKYFVLGNNEIKFFDDFKTKVGSSFNKIKVQGVTVPKPFTDEEEQQSVRAVFDYALGRTDEYKGSDIAGQLLFELLAILNKNMIMDSEVAKLEQYLGVDEKEIKTLTKGVKSLVRFETNIFSDIFREIKTLYLFGKPVPNIGDNVIANIIEAVTTLEILKFLITRMSKEKSANQDDKVEKTQQQIANQKSRLEESINKAKKSVRESLNGSKAFNRYAKDSQINNGIYSLFIPDSSLADDEIMIPNPKGLKGAEKFNYPKIGDTIVNARHPVTTIIMKFKVVGYTDDMSIRVSTAVSLAYYGDGDGDAHSTSWGKFLELLEFSDVTDLQEFLTSADINIESSIGYTINKDKLDNLMDMSCQYMTDDSVTDMSKLDKTASEQAKAKQITQSVTGSFGAVERNLVVNMITNNEDITCDLVHKKSWLSQVPVQAKNILEDIRSGKVDQLTKDTILLFEKVSENQIVAVRTIATLMDISQKEAFELINSYKGIKPSVYAIPKSNKSSSDREKERLLEELTAMINS